MALDCEDQWWDGIPSHWSLEIYLRRNLEDKDQIKSDYSACMSGVYELLTTEQVAAELGVTSSRVRQLVRNGQIKPEGYTPRVHLFRREVIELYKEAPKPPRGRPRKI